MVCTHAPLWRVAYGKLENAHFRITAQAHTNEIQRPILWASAIEYKVDMFFPYRLRQRCAETSRKVKGGARG